MLESFIKNYTKKITKNDIINFSKKENIELNSDELNIIYDQIHNNIDNLIKNQEKEIEKIKDKLSNTTYLKLLNLVKTYKEKYKDYL